MDSELWATEAEARTLRLVADTRAVEAASARSDLDQRQALVRDMRQAALTAVEEVYDDADQQLRAEELQVLTADLLTARLELEAVRAKIKAASLRSG